MLNRLTVTDLPGGSSGDIYMNYDFLGDLLYARCGAHTSHDRVTGRQ